MNKKGQSVTLYTIGSIALLFGVAMVILVTTSDVVQDVKTDQATQATTTRTVTNETATGNVTLAFAGALTLSSNIANTTAIVANASNSNIIAGLSGAAVVNWTLNDKGVFERHMDTTSNVLNVTYTYTAVAPTAGFNVSTKGGTGLINLAGQMPSSGTVIGAAVIIGVLLAAFAFYKFGGGVNFQR